MGTPLVGTFCAAAALPFIGLEVNQRPLLLCLSVPNLITTGPIGHILDYGYSAHHWWILGRGTFFRHL